MANATNSISNPIQAPAPVNQDIQAKDVEMVAKKEEIMDSSMDCGDDDVGDGDDAKTGVNLPGGVSVQANGVGAQDNQFFTNNTEKPLAQ
jgi:hypothetical protein